MIVLVEPPAPPGFVSGGYRYQERVAAELGARGAGRLVTAAPAELETTTARLRAAGDTVVVDGLFAARGAPLPDGTIALLHAEPAVGWSRAPLHAIATGAPTAARVRASCRSVAVVRPGLDACFAPGRPRACAPDDPIRIVCVGTLSPGKDQLGLVRALRGVAAPWHLTLLGDHASDPGYSDRVRATAGDLPVTFAGALAPTQVAATLAASDLCVSASRSESFGMAVAEAAACGVPVLAFATGEIDTFVADGLSGWLLPPDAAEPALAHALATLLAQPARLGAARERVRRPPLDDWARVAERFAAACRAAAG